MIETSVKRHTLLVLCTAQGWPNIWGTAGLKLRDLDLDCCVLSSTQPQLGLWRWVLPENSLTYGDKEMNPGPCNYYTYYPTTELKTIYTCMVWAQKHDAKDRHTLRQSSDHQSLCVSACMQEASLWSASVVKLARAAQTESKASDTMQVKVPVCSRCEIVLGTLQAWLDPTIHSEIMKFKRSAKQTGLARSHSETVPRGDH